MMIDCAVVTKKGAVRDNNEDNYCADGHLNDRSAAEDRYRFTTDLKHETFHDIAVFDGLGGEACGEFASRIAAVYYAEYSARGMGGFFEEYVRAANDAMVREASAMGVRGIGSTAALLHMDRGGADICNIGDSRVYLYCAGELQLLSTDHRIRINDRKSTTLTQHLGISPDDFIPEPFIIRGIKFEPGALFLLCSDGITDTLMDPELQGILEAYKKLPSDDIAEIIVKAAFDHGSVDDITVAVVRAV